MSGRVQIADCPVCRREVLEVDVGGEKVLVERAESVPAYPCPRCLAVSARGDAPGPCSRCGGTRRVGVEKMPDEGVAIDEGGTPRRVRRYAHGLSRSRGEGVHALHECNAGQLAL